MGQCFTELLKNNTGTVFFHTRCINKHLANIVLLIHNRSISLSWLSILYFFSESKTMIYFLKSAQYRGMTNTNSPNNSAIAAKVLVLSATQRRPRSKSKSRRSDRSDISDDLRVRSTISAPTQKSILISPLTTSASRKKFCAGAEFIIIITERHVMIDPDTDRGGTRKWFWKGRIGLESRKTTKRDAECVERDRGFVPPQPTRRLGGAP